jgi:DNA primase
MTDQKVDYSPVIDILEDILGDPKLHNDYKGQISFDCPVCSYEIKELDHGDGKGNLEINYKESVFKCWSCSETHGTHGTLYKLIKQHGNPKQLKKYLILRPDEDGEAPKRIYKQVRLPKEFIAFKDASRGLRLTSQFKQAWAYIKKRNITDEILERYNIGFCYEGDFANRIIIPSYNEEGYLNYFIARSYLSYTKLKYKNPEVQKEIIIFNEKLINWNEKIYIVEGAFDSIFIQNSIPMLGKFMSDHLFNKLYDNAKGELTIVLDPDAWNDAEKLYHKINCGKLMGRVNIIKLEGDKDIADLAGDLSEYKERKLD